MRCYRSRVLFRSVSPIRHPPRWRRARRVASLPEADGLDCLSQRSVMAREGGPPRQAGSDRVCALAVLFRSGNLKLMTGLRRMPIAERCDKNQSRRPLGRCRFCRILCHSRVYWRGFKNVRAAIGNGDLSALMLVGLGSESVVVLKPLIGRNFVSVGVKLTS